MDSEVHQSEGLHKLIDIDATILVEVDAKSQVCNGFVADLRFKMGAQEFPGLTELLEWDQPWKERGRGLTSTLYTFVTYKCDFK